MRLIWRLAPGAAVILAACLGYLYGAYGNVAADAALKPTIAAADATLEPPPEPLPAPPAPSPIEREQQAVNYAEVAQRLEAIEMSLRALASRMPEPNAWASTVERATEQVRRKCQPAVKACVLF